MPVDVRAKAEFSDRYWYFLVDAVTVAFVAGLMLWNRVSGAEVGLRLTNWRENVAIGFVAGGLRVLLLGLLARLFPSVRASDRLQRRSVLLWTTVFFTGAFSEELWIAFCLIVLKTTGHSTAVSVALTAIVFGAVHFEYRFGLLATAMYGAVSALLFLGSASLIPMFVFHFIGNLGSLYWQRHRAGS